MSAGPAQVANVLQQFPAQRDLLLTWLHTNCGNAYVQAVFAQVGPQGSAAWDVVAAPHLVRFPSTEVGTVSSPQPIMLTNHGQHPVDILSLEVMPHAGTSEPAELGELELIEGRAGHLRPLETMAVQVVFRPKRVAPHVGARLHIRGVGEQHLDVMLKATSTPARPEHAEQREFVVAQHSSHQLETAGTPSISRYGDMLAAVLAARTLTDRALPDDTDAHSRIIELLDPVARRLNQLNDHQGRFAKFGAGNLAGQAALDMSESAVRRWLQLVALGSMIRTEELVTSFRAGAEPIRFLTGEGADASTLREFDHVSRVVGIGAAASVVSPAVAAVAIEEAPLLAFAARLASRRVALWALSHPAAALATSEALLGLGVQIGDNGWDAFWDQLRDPQGRWFIIAQVLMDYMHVKSGMGEHGESSMDQPPGVMGKSSTAPAPDVDGARLQVARLRATLQAVHDAAEQEAAPPSRAVDTQPDPTQPQHASTQDRSASTAARNAHLNGALEDASLQLGTHDTAAMLLDEIERNAGGLRRPALETLEPEETERLAQEFADLGGDPSMLRFNQGRQTGFKDDTNTIQVRGDVNPVADSLHPRSAMSSKAALGHELGHAEHRGTPLPVGAWNDEFRASYWAAKNLPNLSEQDRIHLMLDAMERAKEAGVSFRPNALMRKILYGY